jgi:putative membrane protein insertion efficiency factor
MKTICLVLLLFAVKVTLSQNTTNLFNSLIINKLETKQSKTVSAYKNSGFLLKFYKNFISSQDGNGCSFYPSCSQFAAHAVVHHGLFLGTLLSFDRITRCNGRNESFYLTKPEFNKQFDPVK